MTTKLLLVLCSSLATVADPVLAAEAATSLASEVDGLRREGRLEDALARARAETARLRGTEEASSERALEALALEQDLLHELGRFGQAQGLARRRIEIARTAGDQRELLAAHRTSARSFMAVSRFQDAAEHLRSALELARRLAVAEEALDLTLSLSHAESALGRYPAAEALLEEAEELWRRSPAAAAGARLWNERATLLSYSGMRSEALAARRRALDLVREAEDPGQLITTLTNLGQDLMQVHEYAEGIATFHEALDHPRLGSRRILVLVSLGICHFELNQLDAAEVVFTEARQEAGRLGNAAVQAWAVGEIGLTVWKRDGDEEGALRRYREAAAAFRRLGDPRNETVWLMNQAVVLRDVGRYEEALALNRQARRRLEALPGQRVPANLLKNTAQCLLALGRVVEGEALLRRAVAVAEAADDQKIAWEAHRELARWLRAQGRTAEAVTEYGAALEWIEKLRGSLRLESFKTDFFEDKVEVYGELVALLLDDAASNDSVGQAFAVAERARARAFLDSLAESRADLHETLPPALLEEEERVLRELSAVQAQARQGAADADLPARRDELERRLEALVLEARARHPQYRELRFPQTASLAEVQEILREGEGLLAFSLAEPASWLWFVERDDVALRRLPEAGVLDREVRRAMAGLLDPSAAIEGEEALARVLLGPLAGEKALPRRLIVVSSGILHHFPFETLPVAGGGALLGEEVALSYVPSATALVRLRGERRPSRPPRLLAVGDAFYTGAQPAEERSMLRLGRLAPLPHTRREVLALRSLFGAGHSTLLLGPEATETRLKTLDLGAYSVIHLATHGRIDARSPARSGLVLGEDDGREDGLLQMREIFRLPLAADLVTLSACQSALGPVVTGEGLVGLARAFFYAGTGSVVASLWNVNDEAAARLMEGFYRELSRGVSKAEALRRAKIELRDDARFRHPYYWASFVLLGRGDDTVSFPPSVRGAAMGLGILFAALFTAFMAAARGRELARRGRS